MDAVNACTWVIADDDNVDDKDVEVDDDDGAEEAERAMAIRCSWSTRISSA